MLCSSMDSSCHTIPLYTMYKISRITAKTVTVFLRIDLTFLLFSAIKTCHVSSLIARKTTIYFSPIFARKPPPTHRHQFNTRHVSSLIAKKTTIYFSPIFASKPPPTHRHQFDKMIKPKAGSLNSMIVER